MPAVCMNDRMRCLATSEVLDEEVAGVAVLTDPDPCSVAR